MLQGPGQCGPKYIKDKVLKIQKQNVSSSVQWKKLRAGTGGENITKCNSVKEEAVQWECRRALQIDLRLG